MSEALIAGLRHADRVPASRLLASDINDSRLTSLQQTYKIGTTRSNCAVAQEADILVLAVEPQDNSLVVYFVDIDPGADHYTIKISLSEK